MTASEKLSSAAYIIKVFATKLVAIYPTATHTAMHFAVPMDITSVHEVSLMAVRTPKASHEVVS